MFLELFPFFLMKHILERPSWDSSSKRTQDTSTIACSACLPGLHARDCWLTRNVLFFGAKLGVWFGDLLTTQGVRMMINFEVSQVCSAIPRNDWICDLVLCKIGWVVPSEVLSEFHIPALLKGCNVVMRILYLQHTVDPLYNIVCLLEKQVSYFQIGWDLQTLHPQVLMLTFKMVTFMPCTSKWWCPEGNATGYFKNKDTENDLSHSISAGGWHLRCMRWRWLCPGDLVWIS